MNWGSDFNFTFDQTAKPREEDLIAVPTLDERQQGPGTVIARNPHNGKSATLPGEVANALTYCTQFRTLEEHAIELSNGAAAGDPRRQAIKTVLQQVVSAGLTVSARQTLAPLKPVSTEVIDTPLTAVIITCDRPLALKRLLGSILEHTAMEQLDRLIVVDDSRLEINQQQNRTIVEGLQPQTPTPLIHFGATAAQQYTDRLVRQLPHQATAIRCLLDRGKWSGYYSAGVARNFSHILTTGQRVVVFDDDTVCEYWAAPHPGKGCEFNGARRQALFFKRLEDEPRLLSDHLADPVQQLTQCLGLTIPEALGQLNIEGPPLSSLRHTHADRARYFTPGSRVLVTECGSVGDPGTSDDTWLGLLPEETLHRMISDPGQASAALQGAHCWLAPDQPSFGSAAHMSQITGFDNRELLPPYMPVERGQDQIFGEMTRFIHPGSVALTHPWAIKHLRMDSGSDAGPVSRRMSPDGALSRLTLLPARQISECEATRTADRFEFLANSFATLADTQPDRVLQQAEENTRQRNNSMIEGIRNRLDEFEELPEGWRSRLQTQLGQLENADPRPATGGEEAKTLRFWSSTWQEFGEALAAWPEIRAAAEPDQ